MDYDLQKQILPQLKQALNSTKSQSFGRRLYQIHIGEQEYWLKSQIKNVSSQHELSFMHEVNQYQWIAKHSAEIVAPFKLIELTDLVCGEQGAINPMLVVKNLQPLFQQSSQLLSLTEIKQRLLQSVEVLERLHQLGLIHGDLKFEHFRQFQNRAVLIDLEQCVAIENIQLIENTATPRYMAPELFHAASKSFQSDAYALGIIWLEWLTQQKLQQKSYLEWAKLHCQNLKIDLQAEFSVFEVVLEQLLQKKKALRCTNFYQIKQQLNNIA